MAKITAWGYKEPAATAVADGGGTRLGMLMTGTSETETRGDGDGGSGKDAVQAIDMGVDALWKRKEWISIRRNG